MPDRNTPNPNRSMDYNRSQYGLDRFKTPNTSSNYEDEVEEDPRTRQYDAAPNSVEASETFLDDYREHHGLPATDPEGDKYVEPNQDYDFYKTDASEFHYRPRESEGLFQRMKRNFKNWRRTSLRK